MAGWLGLVFYFGSVQLAIALWSSTWSTSTIRKKAARQYWTRPLAGEIKLYELLKITSWKDRLPDAGGLFSPQQKKRTIKRGDMHHFYYETIRAEWAHLLQFIPLAPFFFLESGKWVSWLLLYCIIANMPFIMIQRYNRARLAAIFTRNTRQTTSVE